MEVQKPLILKPEHIYYEIYNFLYMNNFKDNYSFFIPDTILFRNNRPVYWIFNSKKDGSIKRKIKNKVNNNNILLKFSENNCCVIGYYFYHKDNKISLIAETEEDSDKQDNFSQMKKYLKEIQYEIRNPQDFDKNFSKNNLKFEFFQTTKDLKAFLEMNNKIEGILQFFVKSANNPNHMFRILWTPKSSIYDLRKSRHSAESSRVHFYEQCVTYETEKFNILTGEIFIKY